MIRNQKCGASLILLSLSCLLASCDQWSATQSTTSEDIKQIRKAVEEMNSKISKLDDRVSELDGRADIAELVQKQGKTAAFDPSEPKSGFSKIESSTGYFLVSLENVQPYLDGQRVTLQIGNPLSVTYSGFKIKAIWSARLPTFGVADPEFSKKRKAWRDSKRQKEIALTQDLRPGTWNRISFVVAPAKAEEFGYLEIGIETNQVKLFESR